MMYKIFSLILITVFLKTVWGRVNNDEIYNKYKFMYSTGDNGAHSRTEESNAMGHVSGMYQYKDPNGQLRIVQYKSTPESGFQAYGEGIPVIETNPNRIELQEYSISSDNPGDVIPTIEMSLNDTTSVKQLEATQFSGKRIPTIQRAVNNIPLRLLKVRQNNVKRILLVEPESREIKNKELPSQKHGNSSEESGVALQKSTSIENLQEREIVNKTNINSTEQSRNETEKGQQSKIVKEIPPFQSFHDVDFRFLPPPSYPFRFYKIPIVPIIAFPHTLPIITPTFRYAL